MDNKKSIKKAKEHGFEIYKLGRHQGYDQGYRDGIKKFKELLLKEKNQIK